MHERESMNEIIEGKYKRIEVIGRGGTSTVYLALDFRLGKKWAIKEISKGETERKARWDTTELMREAQLLKELDHPALPRIVDILQEDSKIYIVMDYVAGKSLSEILKENGVISEAKVIEWGKKLCQVLSYLHNRKPPIIYRDMKPGNIILTPEGEIKLIDFGIAREFDEEKKEDTLHLGTRGYAAPEQFGGNGQTDERTDIYSLGVTLYHLVTGKNPCEAPYEIYPIRIWNKQLSEGLESILCKCHNPNPNMRYKSIKEVYNELCNYKEKEKKYRRKLMIQIGIFIFFFVCSVIGLGSALVARSLKERELSYRYEKLIQTVGEESEKQKAYLEAINLKPENITAYDKLVDLYSVRGLDRKKERILVECILHNEKKMQGQSGYGNLCFRIGSLYWNLKSNDKNNIKSSFPWYERASKYMGEEYIFNKDVTRAYTNIGRFYTKINTVISYESYSDKDFLDFWNELVKVDGILRKNKTELADTRNIFYQLAKEAIAGFYEKFRLVGVKAKKMIELLNGEVDKKDSVFRRIKKMSENEKKERGK